MKVASKGAKVLKKVPGGKQIAQMGTQMAAKFEKPQKFPTSTMIIAGIASLLFIIAYAKGMAKSDNRQCGRGWFALMMLPLVVGIVYTFIGKMIAYKGKKMYSPNPLPSMILFTIIMLVMQYFASAFLMMKHVPEAPKGEVMKKAGLSLIFVGITCAVTTLSYWVFRTLVHSKTVRLALKGIPVIGWIANIIIKVVSVLWKIVDKVPFLRKLYSTHIHMLPAFGLGNFILVAWIPLLGMILSPIAMFIPFTPLAALGGHGMACEILRKEHGGSPAAPVVKKEAYTSLTEDERNELRNITMGLNVDEQELYTNYDYGNDVLASLRA